MTHKILHASEKASPPPHSPDQFPQTSEPARLLPPPQPGKVHPGTHAPLARHIALSLRPAAGGDADAAIAGQGIEGSRRAGSGSGSGSSSGPRERGGGGRWEFGFCGDGGAWRVQLGGGVVVARGGGGGGGLVAGSRGVWGVVFGFSGGDGGGGGEGEVGVSCFKAGLGVFGFWTHS